MFIEILFLKTHIFTIKLLKKKIENEILTIIVYNELKLEL